MIATERKIYQKPQCNIICTETEALLGTASGNAGKIQYEYLQPIITQYFIDNKSEIWLLFLIAHSKR